MQGATAPSESATAEVFEGTRPLLLAIAYRMLGSVSEAEDIVQEAFLRYHRTVGGSAKKAVGSPKAYLVTVTTRLAIDQLRSARSRREQYVGQWLPEPVLNADSPVERHAELNESLSMAFLLLLERLSPVERAVFLLREVFDYGHREIAAMVGKPEASVRQIAVRARRHVEDGRRHSEIDPVAHAELAGRFFTALQAGNIDDLMAVLASDVTMIGDGGGRAPALAEPATGRERVARFLLGLARLASRLELRLRLEQVNGEPGAVIVDPAGRVAAVMAVEIADGSVRAIRSVVNPAKLRHLGPVVNLGELMGS
jgi:RNA polymerase sigma-70 factor (ECF subfamily)